MKRIVCGPNAVEIAIKNNGKDIQALYVQSGIAEKTVSRIFGAARKQNLTPVSVTLEHLNTLAPQLNHQGVVAITGAYSYVDLESLIGTCQSNEKNLVVVLDQIQDPGNLGAIVRTARCMGATGVITTKNRSAPMTAGAIRSTAGASELIPVCRVTNLAQALEQLQMNHFVVYGAAMRQDHPLASLHFANNSAIVLGNEAKGIRQLTASKCDHLFSIEMPGEFESLNVASAASISLYTASMQLGL